MVDTEELDKRIKDSGLTKKWIASKIGCSIQSFRLKSINKYDFKLSEVRVLCDVLKLDNRDMESIFFKPM